MGSKEADAGRAVGKLLQWSRWDMIAWTRMVLVEMREEHGF